MSLQTLKVQARGTDHFVGVSKMVGGAADQSQRDSRMGTRAVSDLKQTIAGFSLSFWERVGVRVRPLPNMAEILEA